MNLPKWAPWALIAWLVMKDKKAAASTSKKPNGKPAPPAPTRAFLYQLPSDGYETVRMSFAPPGQRPREMGIFQNEAAALKVAKGKGWKLAWPGVRQLQSAPVQGR
jgi:hypothetical protein